MTSTEDQLPSVLKSPAPRCGKWTIEEEKYALQIIENYDNGCLDEPGGARLRAVLAKSLHCDPMRISKKFTRDESIGKKFYCPLMRNPENSRFINESQAKLKELREDWIKQLQAEEEWNKKKLTSKPNKSLIMKVETKIDLPMFKEEAEMRKRLQFLLPDVNAIDFTIRSIQSFFRYCNQTPTNTDVEKAVHRQDLNIPTLHAIISSGCCLVEDPMLNHFHRAVVSYMFSYREESNYSSSHHPGSQIHLIGDLPLLNKSKTKVLNPFPKSAASSSESSEDCALLRAGPKLTEACLKTGLSGFIGNVKGEGSLPGDDKNNSITESYVTSKCNDDSNSQSDENYDQVQYFQRLNNISNQRINKKHARSDITNSGDESSRNLKRVRGMMVEENKGLELIKEDNSDGCTTTSDSTVKFSLSPHTVLAEYLKILQNSHDNVRNGDDEEAHNYY